MPIQTLPPPRLCSTFFLVLVVGAVATMLSGVGQPK